MKKKTRKIVLIIVISCMFTGIIAKMIFASHLFGNAAFGIACFISILTLVRDWDTDVIIDDDEYTE